MPLIWIKIGKFNLHEAWNYTKIRNGTHLQNTHTQRKLLRRAEIQTDKWVSCFTNAEPNYFLISPIITEECFTLWFSKGDIMKILEIWIVAWERTK